MNQKKARSKMCLLDIEVNRLSKVLFILMLLLSLSISVLNGWHGDYGMFFLRVVLLLSSIIPISLRVNLDLAKLYYSYSINTDEEIEGSTARNSNIPEDLGRLSYLITDKTGTLTQNEMLLKKVCTEFAIFEADDPSKDLQRILEENVEKFPQGPCNDAAGPDASAIDHSAVDEGGRPKKKKKRDQGNNVRDLITALAICNNVTPVPDDPDLKNALDVAKEIKGRGTIQPPRSSQMF
jgi:phospholipid-translocating ATPase